MKAEEIVKEIKLFNPEIIGVELCEFRFNQMFQDEPLIPTSSKETLLQKISKSIKKKAEEENLEYGSDMKTASMYAQENDIGLSLLDRSIIEINDAMQRLPKEELNGFLSELQKFENQKLEDSKEIDENKVLEKLKSKYPMAYQILIVSRDLFIAYRIQRLLIKFPDKRLLCFLGKGHVNKIKELLEIKESNSEKKPVVQEEVKGGIEKW